MAPTWMPGTIPSLTVEALTASSTSVAKARPVCRLETPSRNTCFKASLTTDSRRW